MILCDWQIAELCKKGMITPFRPENLNAGSLDITLSNKFSTLAPTNLDRGIDLTDTSSFTYTEVEVDEIVIPPNGFVLALMEEKMALPDDVCAKLFGRSSWARGGLDNSSCGSWCDGGFCGSVVLEIKNLTHYRQTLKAGTKCGQLVFYPMEMPEVPYGAKKTSKYQNQEGLQGSKGSA